MSYPQQGYPQQPQVPQGYPQQPTAYYPPAAPPPAPGSASPATAVIGLVLGLLAAAALIVVGVQLLNLVPDGVGLSDWPSEFTTVLVTKFAAAAILLVGALLVALRKVPGAVILALGGAAGVAAILLDPVVLGGDFGEYLKAVFKFDGTESTFRAIALMTSPLVLILAILPPTFTWLRGSRADAVPQYAPQQGFGTPPGGFGEPPQQQNYPQGQQGHPQGW
jgi:hypothetical protein